MTKKDYILIANVFKATVKVWTEALSKCHKSNPFDKYEKIDGINKILASIDVIVKGLCYKLLKENSRFDEIRFIEACGLPKVGQQEKVINAVKNNL